MAASTLRISSCCKTHKLRLKTCQTRCSTFIISLLRTSSGGGGGLQSGDGLLLLTLTTFRRNSAAGNGGGLLLSSSCPATVGFSSGLRVAHHVSVACRQAVAMLHPSDDILTLL
jgi:predicted outer membrane repeat protein